MSIVQTVTWKLSLYIKYVYYEIFVYIGVNWGGGQRGVIAPLKKLGRTLPPLEKTSKI